MLDYVLERLTLLYFLQSKDSYSSISGLGGCGASSLCRRSPRSLILKARQMLQGWEGSCCEKNSGSRVRNIYGGLA